MANIKSAKKRIKVSARQRTENKYFKTTVNTYIKKFRKLIAENNLVEAEEQLVKTISLIDSSASKGVYHDNNASRKVARLSSALHKAKAEAGLLETAKVEEVKAPVVEAKVEEVETEKVAVKKPAAKKATTTTAKKATATKTATAEKKATTTKTAAAKKPAAAKKEVAEKATTTKKTTAKKAE